MTATDVIDLSGDTDDDELSALSVRTKARTGHGGTSRHDRPEHSQTAAIDLTTAEDPIAKLDDLFSQREPIGIPRGREAKPSSRQFSNHESDPLIVESDDEVTDFVTTNSRSALELFKSATSANGVTPRVNTLPAKRKRAPDDDDRKPSAQLPEKRHRVEHRHGESRSSSAGTDKIRKQILGEVGGKLVDDLKRREKPVRDSDSHHSGSDGRIGPVRKRRPKDPKFGRDFARSEDAHASADETAPASSGIASDLVRFATHKSNEVQDFLEDAKKRLNALDTECGASTGSKPQARVTELGGRSELSVEQLEDRSTIRHDQAGQKIGEMHPATMITSSHSKGLVADKSTVLGIHNIAPGAIGYRSSVMAILTNREISPRYERNSTQSQSRSTSEMLPSPKSHSGEPAASSRSGLDKTLPVNDILSTDSINQELSTQLHGEITRAKAAEDCPANDTIEEAVDGKLDTEPGAAAESSSKPASNDISIRGFGMLSLSRQIEHTVGKYLAEMREDTEYQTKALLRRSRCSKNSATRPAAAPVHTARSVARSTFSRLLPITMTRPKDVATGEATDDAVKVSVEVFSGPPSHHKAGKAAFLARPTICSKEDDIKDVPAYAHYISLKSNFLAPNVLTMNVWPYFGEDHVGQNTFDKIYNVDVEHRKRKLCRLLQAQQAEEYMESALQDLGISWTDVLRFLLDPAVDVGTDTNAVWARANRHVFRGEDFPKSSDKWTAVLSKCTASFPSPDTSSTAAILCDNFQRLAKFPLWHIARRSKEVVGVLQNFEGTPNAMTIVERTCRICMRFNCFQHGEMRNAEGSDSEPLYESDEATATDLVHHNKVNYRKRIALLTPPSEHEQTNPKAAIKKDRRYWDNFAKVEERGPFYPCNHPGRSCDEAQCTCVRDNLTCEKTCGCSGSGSCPRRFQGCSCSSLRVRRQGEYVCFKDDRCLCYQLGRECDADLCGRCGVCDVLDPLNRHHDDAMAGKCHNANIQRGLPRHTLLGESGVHGMGLYAGEDVRVHDFLGEYKGEVITRHEGDRRAAVYEHQNLSYLFTLNTKQEVDSTYYGNKIRFINHRPKGGANVYAVIVLVNTVHRIGLFAEKHISVGQELFFDYGPKFPDEQLGGKAITNGKESAPHVRNANLTKEFYDVEDSEDESGNVRARKAPTAGGRGRGRPRKVELTTGGPGRKGGARPGAGRKPSKPLKLSTSHSAPALGDSGSLPEARLAAYNIAGDDGLPLDAAAGADTSKDKDFEPEQSEIEASNGSKSSEYGDGDEGSDDGEGNVRRDRTLQARRRRAELR